MSTTPLTSDELVASYLDSIHEALGAGSTSLLIRQDADAPWRLLQRGGAEPPAELARLDDAIRFASDPRPGEPWLASDPSCEILALCDLDVAATDGPKRRSVDDSPDTVLAVLGLRFADPDARAAAFGPDADGRRPLADVTRLAGELLQHAAKVTATLEEPVSGLPGRARFQLELARHVDEARRRGAPTSLLLVSPDGFGAVNETCGRETGDRVIGEIVKRLRAVLRQDDVVAKYGGAIFTLLLKASDSDAAAIVGRKLCRTLGTLPFLDGTLSLDFSVGCATLDPTAASMEATELLRRADRALGAARHAGGARFERWSEDLERDRSVSADPLSGIFTGNMAKDYRNMALLSETIEAVASARDVRELLESVSRSLIERLKAERVAVSIPTSSGSAVAHCLARKRAADGVYVITRESQLPPEAEALVAEAMGSGRVVDAGMIEGTLAGGAQVLSCAVPLSARRERLGALFLEGRASRFAIDAADAGFLETLGSQLALAFDRASLAEQQFAWQEAESRRLRVQLDELREAVQQTKLVYRSEPMKILMETARRVAATDATVLVTGPSGTGKELVARSVHRLSPRKDQNAVIVDCASVPSTLIESELFGHERGAYTGAEQRKVGRLVEADGGTVILDEIGELPLEVQAKLLRFVQEKEIVPVGGSRAVKVDARVVAATNRDLAVESREGRFRADLYHRLNVVHLEVPPLSARSEDVLYLANHFLQKFSVQYQKGILRRLSDDAERALVAHDWPGNVRELQNRILQAVILSEGLAIDACQLGLAADGSTHATPEPAPQTRPLDRLEAPPREAETPGEETWIRLREALRVAIDEALATSGEEPPAIGTWLSNDLVLEANAGAGEVMRQAAARLGIPEATFRRRLKKARASRDREGERPPHWSTIRDLLSALSSSEAASGEDLVRRARNLLLEDVRDKLPSDVATASALMGVTEPTFRRWSKEIA